MPLSDWAPANSQNVLPFTEDVIEWQFRAVIFWTFDSFGFLNTDIRNVTGGFKIQTHSPGGQLLFEQEVKIPLTMIAQVVVSLGGAGIEFFTWFNTQSENTVNTTVVDGAATGPDNPSWKHTIGGTALAEPGALETGGGSDFTDKTAIIMDWYDSTIYTDALLPFGTTQKIVFDNFGASIPHGVQFQWRAEIGGGFAALVDRPGQVMVAVPKSNKLTLSRTWRGTAGYLSQSTIQGVSNPAIWKDRTNRLWIAGFKDKAWQLWYSLDDGLSVTQALYSATDKTMAGKPIIIWDNSYNNADFAVLSDGTGVSIALRTGSIYFKTAADEYTVARSVGPAVTVAQHKLLCRQLANGHEELVIVYQTTDIFVSLDGGYTWGPEL